MNNTLTIGPGDLRPIEDLTHGTASVGIPFALVDDNIFSNTVTTVPDHSRPIKDLTPGTDALITCVPIGIPSVREWDDIKAEPGKRGTRFVPAFSANDAGDAGRSSGSGVVGGLNGVGRELSLLRYAPRTP